MKTNLATAPVKNAKAKYGKPKVSAFRFSPRSFGQLNESVTRVKWNSVDKKLTLTVYETEEFDAAKWLKYLDEQHIEYQKSPFVDTDNSTIVIDLLDAHDHKLSTMRFKNLIVESHECNLNRDIDDFLKYEVVITYQHVEMVVHADRAIPENPDLENEDEEWQKVEA